MNVLQSLISLYDQLPPDSTYHNVLQLLLMHLPEAADANIYELAELTNSSRSTIRRMLSMINYDNYQDFHFALKQAVHHYPYYNRLVSSSHMDDSDTVIQRITDQLQQLELIMNKSLKGRELEELAARVHQSDMVCFFFPFHSAVFNSFQQNLAMTGVQTCMAELPPEIISYSEKLTSRSIVFCQTIEHAETMDMTPVFQKIRSKKAYTILFSSGESQYDDYVNLQLFQGLTINSAIGSVMAMEIFLLALSEIYRLRYIDS